MTTNELQQFKCIKNSFATAIQHCSMKTSSFCLSSIKPQTRRMSEEDPLQTSEKAAKNTREKKIALFISFPPLSFSLSHSPQGSIRK